MSELGLGLAAIRLMQEVYVKTESKEDSTVCMKEKSSGEARLGQI